MKRILAISAIGILTLSGCLKEDSRSYLTQEQAFTSAQNLYINSVAFLYGYIGGSGDSQGLQGTCRGVYDYNTMTTDEAMIPIREATGMTAACGRTCISTGGPQAMPPCTRPGSTCTR